MKDIYSILKDAGVEIPEDKKEAFQKDLYANYKAVAEVQKKDDRIKELETQIGEVKESLKKFDGVDVDQLKGQIKDLNDQIAKKESDYSAKVASLEFDNSLEHAIAGAKGKNPKAIKALLDVETLKKSTNKDADIAAAIEAVKKENDYLFGEVETPPNYSPNTGRKQTNGGGNKNYSKEELAFMEGAGLLDDDEE